MIRQTSIEVYHRIKSEGLLSKKRFLVYGILYECGRLTGSQVAQIFKSKYPSAQHSESIRNRITELVQQGVVKEVDIVECPITGNRVLRFETTNEFPVKIHRKRTLKENKEDILQDIHGLALLLDDNEKDLLRVIYNKISKL